MGIPYSKQIRAGLEQVTPLVAAGFQMMQTTRNISMLLAGIQVLNVVLFGCVQATLLALLVTVNPDLQRERQVLVTPVVRWVACALLTMVAWRRCVAAVALLAVAVSYANRHALLLMYRRHWSLGRVGHDDDGRAAGELSEPAPEVQTTDVSGKPHGKKGGDGDG